MPKDIHIVLIEDDLYARDLMSLLLTRDWRTRIVGEAGSEDDVKELFDHLTQKTDAILLDTEVPEDPEWPFRVCELGQAMDVKPKIITTATRANQDVLKKLISGKFDGYLIKREVRYSLATAITLAVKMNKFVVTPSVYRLALRQRIALPDNTVILDGSKPVANLTPRESEVARLAILFNLAHRDLSDELVIRADQVSKYVSAAYTKLGLDEILSKTTSANVFFQDELVLAHFEQILTRVEGSASKRKTSDMATLAFHLLTVPELREIF